MQGFPSDLTAELGQGRRWEAVRSGSHNGGGGSFLVEGWVWSLILVGLFCEFRIEEGLEVEVEEEEKEK